MHPRSHGQIKCLKLCNFNSYNGEPLQPQIVGGIESVSLLRAMEDGEFVVEVSIQLDFPTLVIKWIMKLLLTVSHKRSKWDRRN